MPNDIERQQHTEQKTNGYVRGRDTPVSSSVYANQITEDETYRKVAVTHGSLQERGQRESV